MVQAVVTGDDCPQHVSTQAIALFAFLGGTLSGSMCTC